MAIMTKKDKFFDVLKNIFIGAKIEGKSGYVNLMRIKSAYYSEFKEQVLKDIEVKLQEVGEYFEEEMYNKLYTFFKKYFSESGSIYFTYTPLQEKVYEQIYRDDKDVMLFWKTHMLYYIKSERIYKNLEVEYEEIYYTFDVSQIEHKKSNERKELLFEFGSAEFKNNKRQILFFVNYSSNGKKTKTDDILKKTKKASRVFGDITEKQIERAFDIFKKQSEVDFFINKNSKEFLKEQFALWIKGYVLDDETTFEEARLKQLKALQTIAFNIIDLVSQFEDELVKIWNKPKFVHSSNYIVTLDNIAKNNFTLLEKILRHKGLVEQIKEWKELNILDAKNTLKDFIIDKKLNDKYQNLPLDTKYIKDLELDILALFEDLDNQLDGWLIHSENYQALNTIKSKFRRRVQTIYIDPPYNSPTSEIIYINNYKHSSWITLMDNRFDVANELLSNDGVLECAIDKQEQESLGKLLSQKYPDKEKVCISIVHNPRGVQGDDFAYTNEYTYCLFNKKSLNKLPRPDVENRNLRDNGGESLRTDAKNCFYPIIIKDNNITGFGPVPKDSVHPNTKNVVQADGSIYIYPIDGSGIERKWRYAKQTIESILHLLNVKYIKGQYEIYKLKEEDRPKTVWTDARYDANEYGKKILNSIVPNTDFDFPKSLYNIQDCIKIASKDDSIILDYFPGSGTTAHAVIDLNKSIPKSKRKFILTELGDHFNTTILPRVKKLAVSSQFVDGKPMDNKGISLFVKYFTLEQYEEALNKVIYENNNALPSQDIYHQYLFLKDRKLIDKVIELDTDSKSIKVDLTKLHKDIDIAETLSHLTGKFIKQIKKHEVIFNDDSKIDFRNIDYKIVKPLIWW
jgi:adenine specific DNA methylase Mod